MLIAELLVRHGGQMPHDVAADFSIHVGQQVHERINGLGQPDADHRLNHGAAAGEYVGKVFQPGHPLQRRQRLLVALFSPGIGHA